MVALELEAAKNIAIAVAIVFVVMAVAAAWLMKTLIQKLATVAVFAVLAFAVWTQRTSLQDCAEAVRAAYSRDGTELSLDATECSFFGTTVTIEDPRPDGISNDTPTDTDTDG